MLFKEEHKKMILENRKTQTRRIWKKPRVKVGGIYKAKTKMLSKDYFAKIKVIQLFKQKLADMTHTEVWKEGYSNIIEFQDIWRKINGTWNPHQEVDVIEFEVVERGLNLASTQERD